MMLRDPSALFMQLLAKFTSLLNCPFVQSVANEVEGHKCRKKNPKCYWHCIHPLACFCIVIQCHEHVFRAVRILANVTWGIISLHWGLACDGRRAILLCTFHCQVTLWSQPDGVVFQIHH